jgi:DNA replication protein DnaD
MEGFVKLHRKILEWEWYSDINVSRLFFHLLFKASFRDTIWQGNSIKRGQLITSLKSLSIETNLSIKEIRTALKKLKKTKEIYSQGASKFTIITIVNYNTYQDVITEKGEQRASEGQAKGKRGASKGQHLKNVKNVKNVKKKEYIDKENEIKKIEVVINPNDINYQIAKQLGHI